MKRDNHVNNVNHDTVGMVAIDKSGNVAAGTSTNGAGFKIPGLVFWIIKIARLPVYSSPRIKFVYWQANKICVFYF